MNCAISMILPNFKCFIFALKLVLHNVKMDGKICADNCKL